MSEGDTDTVTTGRRSSATRRSGSRRSAALVGGVVVLLLKAHALTIALDTHAGPIVLLSLLLASAILRIRPVLAAFSAAALVAFVDRPASLVVGVGLAAAVCAVLLALSFMISTALHLHQRSRTGAW